MNYCTKCQSYYGKPGTCNCYATVQPSPLPVQPWPVTPWPYRIWIGDPPSYPNGTTTITWGHAWAGANPTSHTAVRPDVPFSYT